MSICSICRGAHHASSCRFRSVGRARPEPAARPVPLTADQLDDMAYRAKENRPLKRTEIEALIAAARLWSTHVETQIELINFRKLQDAMRRAL